jgi:hypothetical protein
MPAEKTHHPVRPPSGVPNPMALKKIFARKTKTGCLCLRIRYNLLDVIRCFWRDSLIGVKNKNPGLTAFVYGQLLLRAETMPGLPVHIAPKCRSNFQRGILTARINHNDLGGKCNALQAGMDVRFFVLGYNRHG